MRKWGKVAIAVLLICLVGWFTLSSLKPPEPVYQGRRLSQWLDVCNETSNIDDTRPVSEALHAMGTNCLPFLVAHVGHTQSRVKTWLLTQLCKQKLVKLPYYAGDRYASVSTWAIKELGPIAAPAVPQLERLAVSSDDGVSWGAMTALVGIGSKSIPALETVCGSTNRRTRQQAIEMMARIRAEPDNFLSWGWSTDPLNGRRVFIVGLTLSDNDIGQITLMLQNQNPAVRRAAAETLGTYASWPVYSPAISKSVPALLLCVSDPDWQVRRAAIETLGMISQDAGKIQPVLSKSLADGNPEVRDTAAKALQKLATNALAYPKVSARQ